MAVASVPSAIAGTEPRLDAARVDPAAGIRVEPIGHGHCDSVILPLDAFFPLRLASAQRLWRVLNGRPPGPDPQRLTRQRRRRLLLALRGLDARLAGASYREIAEALFGPVPLTGDADWNSHDLRDRTIRLARLGVKLMRGDYRRLLLYPYRRKR
ncbi:DUF2285 domain-containing protein [Sphingosinicella rhizophila]|uniref:DUF2285 domain-containing protein n=1 Tax=Sphingosinicella rhizophila TaxID=3050082 RepID=UPI00396560F9